MRCADPEEAGCQRDALALVVVDDVDVIVPACGDCALRVQHRLPGVRLRWVERQPGPRRSAVNGLTCTT